MGRSFSYTVNNNSVYTPLQQYTRGFITIKNCILDESSGNITVYFDAGFEITNTRYNGVVLSALAVAFDGDVKDDGASIDSNMTTSEGFRYYQDNYMIHPARASYYLKNSGWGTTTRKITFLENSSHTINALNSSTLQFGLSVLMNINWTNNNGGNYWINYYIVQNNSGGTITFTLPQYDISFNLNSGSNGPSNSIKNYGVNYTIPNQTPTREGYIFLHWLGSDGNVYDPGSSYTVNADITLTAQWQQNEFTLTIDPDGGEYIQKDGTKSTAIIIKNNIIFSEFRYIPICTGLEDQGQDYGDEGNYGWCISKPVKTGYTLNGKPINNHTGWSIKIDGSNEEAYQGNTITNYYHTATDLSNMFYIENKDKSDPDNPISFNINNNIIITAQWTANTYTVTFNPNGGNVSTTSKEVTYDSTYGDLPNPTRTGYTFNGWYTAPSGGTQITSDSNVSTTEEHTLYAIWEPVGVVKIYTDQGWKSAIPFIYTGSEEDQGWKPSIPYIWDGTAWKTCK